ncbi:hypothetical protein [Rhizobium halophilum]|uniref:hypothetical protein n=1 Tax=Rhizobium halophilum TaxID=2846852 RepID=UPI001EFC90AB|nr:hypothetical protein [Rhizobium halophilum]MCF6371188.1 hypothetical protein [Rhizobium halophilum]
MISTKVERVTLDAPCVRSPALGDRADLYSMKQLISVPQEVQTDATRGLLPRVQARVA